MSERGRCGLEEAVKLILRVMSQRLCIVSLLIMKYLIVYPYFPRSHRSLNRLKDLVAEHLDHLHYLNDILCLQIDALNAVLTDHLLNRLFIPLYIYSIAPPNHGVAGTGTQGDHSSPSTSSASKLQVRSCFPSALNTICSGKD